METGLVLTGGGARAAYQVGVLKAIAEIVPHPDVFSVVTGVSAGAINAVALASAADDLSRGVGALLRTWREVTPEQVYRTDAPRLFMHGARWVAQLAGGGLLGDQMNALLDTTPLEALLKKSLSLPAIGEQLRDGRLRGVAVTATSYHSGTAITFFDAAPDVEPWVRSGRMGIRAPLTLPHVMASAAIPVFFPPVRVGDADFGDGCVRLDTPLSPAIHLGADRIIAIGIRYPRSSFETRRLNSLVRPERARLAEIAGVVLNAVFLDALDSDVERLERINAMLATMTPEQRERQKHPLRHVPVLSLLPTRDLGRMAMQQLRHLPLTLRHLLAGIGAHGERGWDIASYLAFDPIYIRSLIELGYEDTMGRRAQVEGFLAPAPSSKPESALVMPPRVATL